MKDTKKEREKEKERERERNKSQRSRGIRRREEGKIGPGER